MADDPFFGTGQDANWNACTGEQSDAENYVDGYLEAATELVTAIFEKELYSRRDTLVFPILFTARHSIELMLKYVIGDLRSCGVIEGAHAKNHDIRGHFDFLCDKKVGDEAIRSLLVELEPYVISLARIDEDGQELRYSETREGDQSLATQNIVSLELVRDSLGRLSDLWGRLKSRVHVLQHERGGGFFTAECSRKDLVEIARFLPQRSEWGSAEFEAAKRTIRERFDLSSRKFQRAARLIQGHRQTNLLLGTETKLLHISDSLADFLIQKHVELNSQEASSDLLVSHGDALKRMIENLQPTSNRTKIIAEVLDRMSMSDVADVRAIFYFSRNLELEETYEGEVARGIAALEQNGDIGSELLHVFMKLNFVECFVDGIERLGRPSLGAKIRSKYDI